MRGGLDRESLRLAVVSAGNPAQRAAWLAAHLEALPGSGIVYTLTVAQARDVAALLRERGFEVAAYTGSTEAAEREQLEADLLANRVKALIATSALGMGFDKPDLGFVVHLGAPSSPIAYYQQVGRAGRSTESAEVILLPGREDQEVWRYFASVAFPSEAMVRNVIGALDLERPQSTPALEPLVDLGRSRLEMVLKVLDVDGAVRRVKGGWVATGAAVGVRRTPLPHAGRGPPPRAAGHARLSGHRSSAGCRFCAASSMTPTLGVDERCGRCDNCTGARYQWRRRRGRGRADQGEAMRPGVELAPRKQWPSGLAKLGVDLSGRITDGAGTGSRHRQAHRSGLGFPAARAARRARMPSVPADVVRRRDQGVRGVGLGGAADRGAGAGLRTASAVGLVAGPQAGRTRPADRPRHAALRAAAPAGHGRELGVSSCGAERFVVAARRRPRSGRPAGRCCSSTIWPIPGGR